MTRATNRQVMMNGDEPAVNQGIVNNWIMSWNPDDDRYYVQHGDEVHTFRDWRNALYFARNNQPA